MRFIKKITVVILAAVLFVIIFSECKKISVPHGKPADETYRHTSFRDIPGVTEEEIEAIETLRKETDVFIYGMIMTAEAFYNEHGEVGGFSAFMCEWLTKLFDIPFKPVIYKWDELLTGLASGEIDFSGELTATEIRRKTYYMTDPIAERSIVYLQMSGSIPIQEIIKSRRPKYAFLKGSSTVNDVSSHAEEEFETFLVDNCNMAYNMLKNGEIDAFFGEGIEAYFDIYPDVVTKDIFPIIYGPVSLTTQKPELAPIISIVQKALENEGIRYLTELYNRGYQDYLSHKLFMRLTEEEKAYISANPVIQIAAEYDNYPISFYDKHKNEWQGITFDILREIKFYTGMSFNIANDEKTEWPVLLKKLYDGEADMITELLRTEDRIGNFLWPETSFMIDYYALLSKSEFRNININEIHYMRVGLNKNTPQTETFHKWFPNHKYTVEYEESSEAFTAIDNNEIDMLMSNLSRLLMHTNFYEQAGYKANITFNYPVGSTFGFNKEKELLCSIIDKTLRLIDLEGISGQWMRKTYDYNAKLAKARIPWLAGVSTMSVFILTLLFILFQRKRYEGRLLETLVQERTMELHNSQMELETALDGAQAASRAKSVFLANMSHEIRTPINAIVGMTTIGKSAADVERKDYCFTKISDASQHLLSVIKDVLDMSKIEANKFELSPAEFNFGKMIQQVVNIIIFRIDEKQQKLKINIDESIPNTLIGDDQRLMQVLTNILGNAVKFTPEKGSICLDANLLEENDGICTIKITISDTGIGISEEQQKHIFQSFHQAETSTVRKYGGTGLGLIISKTIVEMMNGWIWINSEIGKGSTFGFTVQMKRLIEKNEILKNQTGAPESKANLVKEFPEDINSLFAGRRILLAEDMEINREIVIALFETTGIEIDQAQNGTEAVRMFIEKPEKYDAILMDLQMPEMDGYEATRRIREFEAERIKSFTYEDSRLSGIPIIAMTANVFQEDIEKCLKEGMNDHVGKPLNFDEVLNKLYFYFRQKDSIQ